MMAVRWGRGFFRLWVAVSVFWFIGTVIVAYMDPGIPSLTKDCTVLMDFTRDSTGEKLGAADVAACEVVWRKQRLKLAATALGPSIAVLIVALILAWVGAGFTGRHSEGPKSN